MPTQLTDYAVEKSTFAIQAGFLDDAGDAVTPDSITWTLCDTNGTVINSRSAVIIAVPAATVTIVLSGSDLQISDQNNEYETRFCAKFVVDRVVLYDALDSAGFVSVKWRWMERSPAW